MMTPRPPGVHAVAAPMNDRTTKGQETRARILAVAIELFRERGYDDTTMRTVADKAGVSLGNAYYYFASKEHLLQGYYAQSHADHVAVALPALARKRDLLARVRTVLHTKVDASEPYHRFAGTLFHAAADPRSPLSPFSAESAETRAKAIALWADVLQGSKRKLPKDLAARLPELLWLYEMGIVLFWIHDESENRARTRRLIERSSELVVRLTLLASNPLLRPLRGSVLRLLEETVGELR